MQRCRICFLFCTFAFLLKRIGNIVTFLVLAALLLLNGTSREYIHSFTGHQDTVDHYHPNDHTDHHAAFEIQHHHCEFLTFLTPVYHPIQECFLVKILAIAKPFFETKATITFVFDRKHTALRGPPIA